MKERSIRREDKYRSNILHSLIYIFLILSPFYFFQSGGLQVSHVFLLLALGVFIVSNRGPKAPLREIQRNWEYLFFLLFVLAINLCYFILYGDANFMRSSLYYIFNFFIIILSSFLFENESFQANFLKIMKGNMLIQLLIYLAGLGRWYGRARYMGTFNDPNQFAFYILISYSFIYLLSKKQNKSITIYSLLAFFLIVISASTGMLLGISLLILLQIINLVKSKMLLRKKKYIFIVAAVVILILFILLLNTDIIKKISSQFSDVSIVQRVEEKIIKRRAGLLAERGYDRIYHYPQYIFFGSGEGYNQRWQKSFHQGELHATLPSVLFCYGIVPLIILISWMYKKIKKLPFDLLLVYIAVIAESFTLLNTRQSLFWMLFVLAPYLKKKAVVI